MALSFRAIWKSLVPRWLNEGEGLLVGYVLTLLLDASLERLRLGHLARFPQQGPDGTPAPDDALAALGRDRGVVRGIEETARSYAYRLTQWLVDARTRGTAFQLMKQVAAYVDFDGSKGCSYRIVDARGNWFSRAADGAETYSLKQGNWNWDSGASASRWGRFWLIIYSGTRWGAASEAYGFSDLKWGDPGRTWGTTSLPEHATTLRQIVSDNKPAGTRCESVIVPIYSTTDFDPTSPAPDGKWGRWSKQNNGVMVASRETGHARYFGGT